MPQGRYMQRFSRSAAAAFALLSDGDFSALARRLIQTITGVRRPLPAELLPDLRPLPEPSRPGDRIIMASPPLNRNGAPLSQFELAKGFAERGWRVLTIAAGDGPLAASYREVGLELEIWPSLTADAAVPAWYERDICALAQAIGGLKPSLVYANTLDLFPVIDAARVAGVPSIWNIREGEPWRQRLSDRHTAIAARALAAFSYPHAVVHVAATTQRVWLDFTPDGRSHVIYNAPFEQAAAPREHEDKPILQIASVGTLCERKGQLDLVEAINLLAPEIRSRLRVVFIGKEDENYADRMRAVIAAAGLPSVTFAGEVTDVGTFLSESDMLVHCARTEAFPRVFLEAAAAGTAIVASRAGGTEERLKEGVSALFYDAGDVDTLAGCITRLAHDPSLRQKLATAARHALVERWTRANMLDAYQQLVNDALTGSHSGT